MECSKLTRNARPRGTIQRGSKPFSFSSTRRNSLGRGLFCLNIILFISRRELQIPGGNNRRDCTKQLEVRSQSNRKRQKKIKKERLTNHFSSLDRLSTHVLCQGRI